MDWLRSLIPDADSFEKVGNVLIGICVALGGLFAGIWARRPAKAEAPKAGSTVEIAGAVIDKKAVQELLAGFAVMTRSLDENTQASRDTAKGISAVVGEVKEANHRLEAIKDELVRGQYRK